MDGSMRPRASFATRQRRSRRDPGEVQRIAFARALVQKPDWLFPTGDLGIRRGDPKRASTGIVDATAGGTQQVG